MKPLRQWVSKNATRGPSSLRTCGRRANRASEQEAAASYAKVELAFKSSTVSGIRTWMTVKKLNTIKSNLCTCMCVCVYITCILTLAQNNGWQFVEPTFCRAEDNEIYFGKHMPQIAARVCMSSCACVYAPKHRHQLQV